MVFYGSHQMVSIGVGILILDLIIVIATMLIDYAVFLERKITNRISRLVIWLFAIGAIAIVIGSILNATN